MSTAARLAAFALVLAAVFAAAAAVGRAVGPFERSVGTHEEMPQEEPHGGEEPAEHEADGPAGLSVAADGLRLVAASTVFEAGAPQELAFTVLQEDEEPLRDYDVVHEREMHLILVRRDLGSFQHLHPERRPDGTWTTTIELPTGGSYRAFADFSTGGGKRTLGIDLVAAGEAAPRPAPAAERWALVDGFRVVLRQEPRHAGEETSLRFLVMRDGRAIGVDEYLGARGHLVVLREGDLAYLHTHAEQEALDFETTFPTPGRYRAFLQFSVDGAVRTAAFELEVGP